MRLQESLHFFYLNLDTTAADYIILSALDSETKFFHLIMFFLLIMFFHLIIYIGFYFHNIIRYQGFGTNQRSIDDETTFISLTDFHAIERLIPFASLIAIDSSQGDMR